MINQYRKNQPATPLRQPSGDLEPRRERAAKKLYDAVKEVVLLDSMKAAPPERVALPERPLSVQDRLTPNGARVATQLKREIELWPEGLTFEQACEYIGRSGKWGRSVGLDTIWEQAGISLHLPGARFPTWRKSLIDAWLDTLQAQQMMARVEGVGSR